MRGPWDSGVRVSPAPAADGHRPAAHLSASATKSQGASWPSPQASQALDLINVHGKRAIAACWAHTRLVENAHLAQAEAGSSVFILLRGHLRRKTGRGEQGLRPQERGSILAGAGVRGGWGSMVFLPATEGTNGRGKV